jgi:hypothetical protein
MEQLITVKPNQSIADVILMACGTLEGGMAFCALNNISISDIPVVGTVYSVPAFNGNPAGLLQAGADEADSGVLEYLVQNEIVIGTLGTAPPPPPPLGFTIVLKPVMSATYTSPSAPSVLGYYPVEYDGTIGFIAINGLAAAYPGTLDLYKQDTASMHGGAIPATVPETGHLPMTGEKLTYHVPWPGALGDIWVWSPTVSGLQAATFADTVGNQAYVSPVVVLYDHTAGIEEYLIADMLLDFVSSDGYTATLRLTRSHAPTAHINIIPPFGHMVMNWLVDAAGGSPDPLDPTNSDKTIISLPPGTYTLGVGTSYVNDVTHYTYTAQSAFTMVITIS